MVSKALPINTIIIGQSMYMTTAIHPIGLAFTYGYDLDVNSTLTAPESVQVLAQSVEYVTKGAIKSWEGGSAIHDARGIPRVKGD